MQSWSTVYLTHALQEDEEVCEHEAAVQTRTDNNDNDNNADNNNAFQLMMS